MRLLQVMQEIVGRAQKAFEVAIAADELVGLELLLGVL
jgi:hypothetical protein